MSRVVTHTETWSGCPTSWSSDYQYYQASSQQNALKPSSNTNYANISLTRGRNAETWWYLVFDTSAIPDNAEIVSCVGKAKAVLSSTNTGYIKSNGRNMQFYSGTNPKGNAYTISTTNSVRTLSIGTWTRQELDNVSIKFYVQRNTGSTNSSIYLRPYGADLTVNYTWDEYFYSITTSSNSQLVTISASENETTGGGTNIITLTNVSSLDTIQLIDNGNDVTSSLVVSGSNYIYILYQIYQPTTQLLFLTYNNKLHLYIEKQTLGANVLKSTRRQIIHGFNKQYHLICLIATRLS